MYDVEREEKILEILKEKRTVGVNNLANMVFCSGATIRRDLVRMEKKGLVVRTFGAVTLNSISTNNESSFEFREKYSISEKRALALKVAACIKGNSTIFIDSSSTLFFIVPFLKDIPNLLIITNGLRIANEVLTQTSHTVVMIGGTIQPNTNSVLGALALEQIQSLHADCALLSCFGFTEKGTSEASADSALLKKEMAKLSDKVIVTFDSHKYGNNGAFKSLDLSYIDTIITNKVFNKTESQLFKDKNIEIINA